jgi:hypothetical protein
MVVSVLYLLLPNRVGLLVRQINGSVRRPRLRDRDRHRVQLFRGVLSAHGSIPSDSVGVGCDLLH